MALGAFGALGVDIVLGFEDVESEVFDSEAFEADSDFEPVEDPLADDDFSAALESLR
ncbi:protein of unknown function [Agreia sp. COWG]|nr:protein of unknown function [Agreia sp. COWG]